MSVTTNGKTALTGTNRLPKQEKESKQLSVPAITVGHCQIEVVGISPLLVHNFSAKSRRMMAEKQQKGATKPREKRDPHADYLGAMYIIEGDASADKAGVPSSKCKAIHGIPASGFKRMMIRSGKLRGAKMTDSSTTFFIRGHESTRLEGRTLRNACVSGPEMGAGGELVRLDFAKVEMHEGVERNSTGVADLRYRPLYTGWRCVLDIEFDAKNQSIEQLVNMLRHAGRFIGWGEKRPERGGQYGRFQVGEVVDLGTEQL